MPIGLDWNSVLIVPYEHEWHTLYLKEADLLFSALSGFEVALEHIGSTAVPGMPAKPIIDIVAAVHSLEMIDHIVDILVNYGYLCLGECGRSERYFFVKGLRTNTTHHLHIVKRDSRYYRNHVLIRDFLRKNTTWADAYAQKKITLAQKYTNDRLSYRSEKGEFIERMLFLAETYEAGR